ncbi:MAG: serine hydrolase, partial [Actinobacteria bacterium]|nr:serine hydrolase [Actinomycetota bacterium]
MTRTLALTGRYADPYVSPTGPTAHPLPLYTGLLGLIYAVFGVTMTGGYVRCLVNIAGYSLATYPLIYYVVAYSPRYAAPVSGILLALAPPRQLRRRGVGVDGRRSMRCMRDRVRSLVLLLAVLVPMLLAPVGAQISTETVFPGQSWEYVPRENLESYGWSPEVLRQATAFIRDHSNTTGLVVVDRGRVVFRYGDIEELSYIASVRKSILSMLYGYWVENGTIKLDTTLDALKFDDIGGLLPIEKQATIGDLITARSGVYHLASYSGDDLAKAPPRGSQKPGTYMLYSNWDFNAAGAVFEQLTGRSIYDELQAQLAIPIQFEDWNRSAQHKEGDLTISKYPAYPIWISTRDMARIGYLMLHEGNWNGTQVISRDWARRIVSVVTPVQQMNPI